MWSFGRRFLVAASCFHFCAVSVLPGGLIGSSGPAAGPFCFPSDAAAVQQVETLFKKQLEKRLPQDISSHHAVLVVPTDPLTAAGGIALEAYLSLPRTILEKSYTTVFTKFVVVGHSRLGGRKGISLGDDVCGSASKLTDTMALKFLETEVFTRMGGLAPTIVACAAANQPCSEHVSPGVTQQLPILSALLGHSRSLAGQLLPVMMQGQDISSAVRLGDALSYLVQTGGLWEAERVLFVFAGDLSEGLPADQEGWCDERVAEVVTQRGIPQAAEYFHDLLAGGVRGGCQGPAAAPRGYGPLLTAARVAALVKLRRRRAVVAHSAPIGAAAQAQHAGSRTARPVVLGFMTAVFWDDTRSVWEKLSGQGMAHASFLSSGRRQR